MWKWILPVLACLTIGAPALTQARAQAPQRVVTVNLCLDQIALRLAAPDQLVGVSYLAHDPRISVLADRARAIAPVRATVESILTLRPDLAIMDDSSHPNLKRLLRGAGVAILEVPWAASLAEAEALTARMASAMGRDEAGRTLIAALQAERHRIMPPQPPFARAAVLQANRGTTGKGSLMDELLRLAGLRNYAAELGLPAYGRWSLETVLSGQPDVLVIDGMANANPARATEFVDHHALRSLAGRARVISVPLRYSLCAGPENLEVVRLLAQARP